MKLACLNDAGPAVMNSACPILDVNQLLLMVIPHYG